MQLPDLHIRARSLSQAGWLQHLLEHPGFDIARAALQYAHLLGERSSAPQTIRMPSCVVGECMPDANSGVLK